MDKLKVETWQVIHEIEFSKFVSEVYGRPYQLQQQEPMMNQDEIRQIRVPPEDYEFDAGHRPNLKEWLERDPKAPTPSEVYEPNRPHQPGLVNRDDKSAIEMWWHREFYPSLEELLKDLHAKGLIDAGDYVIHAWW